VWRGRRSDFLLAGLALVAVANGLFLGLSLYGLLAAALKIVHGQAPALGYAWLIGGLGALFLLLASLRRERQLREGEYRFWAPFPSDSGDNPVVDRLRALVDESSLDRQPILGWIESDDLNAFTVGRSRDEASIILTSALIERLPAEELDAVLAQQLAHVEFEDIRAVGLADAVADSIADLARAKGRFLWGPRAIINDMRPFLLVTAVAFLLMSVLPRSGGEDAGLTLVLLGVSIGLIYAFWLAAKRSWRGLAQLFLFVSFFGPLSLIEAALAPPSAFLLSRLVSRARVQEADERAVKLTGGPDALASALMRLASTERLPSGSWLGQRRFSLFVAPGAEDGSWTWLASYWAWFARQWATHPSIPSRIETIQEPSQDTGSLSSHHSVSSS
jgi:Zn-dependent protease with chaperone function